MSYYAVAPDDVPQLMRDWLTGREKRLPTGLRLRCGQTVVARLRELGIPMPPPPAMRWPYNLVDFGVESVAAVPVEPDSSLPPAAWTLLLAVYPSYIREDAMTPSMVVIREGDIRDGQPTALEREYWLVDFHQTYLAEYRYESLMDGFARQRLVSYVRACGHDADLSRVKVRRVRRSMPWEMAIYEGSISVPREPARYPQCGDWWCEDEADWADVDPVDEPSVFAGAVTEKRYLDSHVSVPGTWWPSHILAEVIQHRRRQADGKPLWTIDVRPKLSGT